MNRINTVESRVLQILRNSPETRYEDSHRLILSCRWLLFSARTTEQELPAEKSLKGSSFYVEELALLHSEIPVISEF